MTETEILPVYKGSGGRDPCTLGSTGIDRMTCGWDGTSRVLDGLWLCNLVLAASYPVASSISGRLACPIVEAFAVSILNFLVSRDLE